MGTSVVRLCEAVKGSGGGYGALGEGVAGARRAGRLARLGPPVTWFGSCGAGKGP